MHLKLVYSRHQSLELPIVYIGSTLHLVLQELGKLSWIVPGVDDSFSEELLLHLAQIFLTVILLTERASWHLCTTNIREELVIGIKVVFILN